MLRHRAPNLRISGLAVCCLTATVLITGCNFGVPGNGVAKIEDRQVDDFDSVSLRGIGSVNITVGEPKSVTVTVDENLMQLLETVVEDGELIIKSRKAIAPRVDLVVNISTPELNAGRVSGVGDMDITGATGDSLDLSVSGVGSLTATGQVTNADVRVSGVGSANLNQLIAENVVVRVSGTGDANVHATSSVDAKVSGIGDIVVHGNPQSVNKSASGIGDVVVKDESAIAE